jgi:amylosucrase
MLLALDVVVNHTSDEHEWARRARAGEKKYQDYYYVFDDRDIPGHLRGNHAGDLPGNRARQLHLGRGDGQVGDDGLQHLPMGPELQQPGVLIEMIDIILFWANQGRRHPAPGRGRVPLEEDGQRLPERARGASAAAIDEGLLPGHRAGRAVHRRGDRRAKRNLKYFGEDAINAKECEIAYNATFMALLWDAMATKNAGC